MKEFTKQLPCLYHFMSGYWMENADLVFGNITGAITAYLEMENEDMISGLLDDLAKVRSLGYLTDRPAHGTEKSKFWLQLGARWLSIEDADLIMYLSNRNRRA